MRSDRSAAMVHQRTLGRPKAALVVALGVAAVMLLFVAVTSSRHAAHQRLTGLRGPDATARQKGSALQQRRDRVEKLLKGEVASGATTMDLEALLQQIAATDPAWALELADRMARSNDERYEWVTVLLQMWTKGDSHQALAWALAHYPREIRGHPSTVGGVLAQIAVMDPQQVVAEVEALLRAPAELHHLDANELANFSVNALIAAGRGDMAKALTDRWARGSLAATLDGTTFQFVAADLARSSPAAAATWLHDLPPSPARDYALGVFGSFWAASSPSDALNWINGLTDDTRRADAMVTVFRHWAERDAVGATEWLEGHESNPVSDRMIISLIESAPALHASPALAAKWAELISDPTQRLLGLQRLLVNWQAQDLAAARRYMEEAPSLTTEERAQLARTLGAPARSGVVAAVPADVLFFK